jgi:hypothetical protein
MMDSLFASSDLLVGWSEIGRCPTTIFPILAPDAQESGRAEERRLGAIPYDY